MRKLHTLTAALGILTFVSLAGCASQGSEETGADAPATAPGQQEMSTEAQIRGPEDPILGEVSEDGLCDGSVVDIDHERPTAHITYKGQPGDQVKMLIKMADPASKDKEQSFELSSTLTEMQLPTNIPNEGIEEISVKAEGRVGTPGECTIPVE